jgi:hypothetical protein
LFVCAKRGEALKAKKAKVINLIFITKILSFYFC